MSAKDDGGPAFPLPCDSETCPHTDCKGMSLRDWLAGQALAGVGTWAPLVPHTGASLDLTNPVIHRARAQWAYAQADAMLTTRATGGGE